MILISLNRRYSAMPKAVRFGPVSPATVNVGPRAWSPGGRAHGLSTNLSTATPT